MKKYFIWFMFVWVCFIICSYAEELQSQKIIPVNKWPKVIYTENKQIYNPTPDQCVEAGYRLKPASRPDTPEGKVIASQTLVQDENNPARVRYEITYEDKPDPPDLPDPVAITNVSPDRVEFLFTTSGVYRGIRWLDAPGTNNPTGKQ